MSIALGFKLSPVCLPCLAKHLGRSLQDTRDDVFDRVTHRDCFLQAWLKSSENEGFGSERRPSCLWSLQASPVATELIPDHTSPKAHDTMATAFWDAGDMSCGDLVLELRGRLYALPAGAILSVRATDKAAPEDLPAWCRVTRNPMIQSNHPYYQIRRKES